MKKNALTFVVIVLVVMSLIASSRLNREPTPGAPAHKDAKIYVMVENRDGAFELAFFNITVGKATLNETDRAVIAYTGHAGKIRLTIHGKATNWGGIRFNVNGTVDVTAKPGGTYLLTLVLQHKPGRFTVVKDSRLSGMIGADVPSAFLESNRGLVEKILTEPRERAELEKNRKLRSRYFQLWVKTGNLSYLQAYRDLNYHPETIAFLYKLGELNEIALQTHLLGLTATDYYYAHFKRPGRKDLVLVFSNHSPYYGVIRVKEGPLKTCLPFVYYRARGFNIYPVSALHWAQMYYERGEEREFLRILDELRPFIELKSRKGQKYALLPVYFHFQNSSIPWVSGYAQGLGAGLYALAYNETRNTSYLRLAKGFFNSFSLPIEAGGFVTETEYGPWCLEYNYYPEQLVFNGNIICLQGLYYYWKVTNDESAHALFLKGTMGVKKALPFFDTGKWSRYASIYNSSSLFYHRLHIRLLLWLYAKTGDKTFLEYAEKWNLYLKRRGEKPEDIRRLLKKMGQPP